MLIPTGLQKVDKFLSGGVPDGVVMDIFGENAVGKTQLLLQIVTNSVARGGHVMYMDTTGKFRPERILNLYPRAGYDGGASALDILDRITVSRIINTSEQIRTVRDLKSDQFSLVVIDNVTDLFSYEFKDMTAEKNLTFMKHMHDLAKFSIKFKIPVIMTNMIRTFQNSQVENMKSAIDPFTHIKIRLSKVGQKFQGRVWWALGSTNFTYKINTSGVSDALYMPDKSL